MSAGTLINSPAVIGVMARSMVNETLYRKLEEILPCDLMSDEMLARMNASLGFSGHHAKGRDYRPYCVRRECKDMPRMMRVTEGFKCWSCGNTWDLTEKEGATP